MMISCNQKNHYTEYLEKKYAEFKEMYSVDGYIIINFYDNIRDYEIAIGRNKKEFEIGTVINNKLFLLTENVIISDTVWDKRHIKKLYLHELIHAFNYLININKSPYWLEEGIASYFSEMFNEKFIQIAINRKKLILFSNLFSKLDWENKSGILKYHQSGSFINYLIQSYSIQKVILFRKLSSNNPSLLNNQFFKIFSIKLDDAINAWKKSILEKDLKEIKQHWLKECMANEL